jgi:hypothetical protein
MEVGPPGGYVNLSGTHVGNLVGTRLGGAARRAIGDKGLVGGRIALRERRQATSRGRSFKVVAGCLRRPLPGFPAISTSFGSGSAVL